MNTVNELLPFVIGGYEVISRAIPTKKNVSLIHNILKALLFISDLFNKKSKSANDTANG